MLETPKGQPTRLEEYQRLTPVERNREFSRILRFIPKGHPPKKPLSREERIAQWNELPPPDSEELESIRRETPEERDATVEGIVMEVFAGVFDTPFLDDEVIISEEIRRQRLNSQVGAILRASLIDLISLARVTDDLKAIIIARFDIQWVIGERLLHGPSPLVRGLPRELPIEVLVGTIDGPGLFDSTTASQLERLAYRYEQIKASPIRSPALDRTDYFDGLVDAFPKELLAPIEPWRTHFIECHDQEP